MVIADVLGSTETVNSVSDRPVRRFVVNVVDDSLDGFLQLALFGEACDIAETGVLEVGAVFRIAAVKVKEYGGGWSASARRCIGRVDKETARAKELTAWYELKRFTLKDLSPTRTSARADARRNAPEVMIEELRRKLLEVRAEGEESFRVPRAVLESVKTPFFYMACSEVIAARTCKKGVMADGFCESCNKVVLPVPVLKAKVSFRDPGDGGENINVTLFDDIAQGLLQVTADDAHAAESSSGTARREISRKVGLLAGEEFTLGLDAKAFESDDRKSFSHALTVFACNPCRLKRARVGEA